MGLPGTIIIPFVRISYGKPGNNDDNIILLLPTLLLDVISTVVRIKIIQQYTP
jgi:hypothetical protein